MAFRYHDNYFMLNSHLTDYSSHMTISTQDIPDAVHYNDINIKLFSIYVITHITAEIYLDREQFDEYEF